MFRNHSSLHQLTKPASRATSLLTATKLPVTARPAFTGIGKFVRYFTNFRPTDTLYIEKSHGGRIAKIDAQDVFQSTALSVWNSWTPSHIVPQRRLVITTDWPPHLRAT
jgi:hypothetical protein